MLRRKICNFEFQRFNPGFLISKTCRAIQLKAQSFLINPKLIRTFILCVNTCKWIILKNESFIAVHSHNYAIPCPKSFVTDQKKCFSLKTFYLCYPFTKIQINQSSHLFSRWVYMRAASGVWMPFFASTLYFVSYKFPFRSKAQ